MINKRLIDSVKAKLIKTYNPCAIYVFGSYAWGTPNEDSDLDVLIVVDELTSTHYKMLAKGHLVLAHLPLSKDLILYSKEEFDALAKVKSALCYRVKQKGLKIYARA